MASRADAIRNGMLQAARILREHDLTESTLGNDRRIDVFEVARLVGLEIMLQPLDGLLGAYLRSPTTGALVSTERPHSIQRFTAAHELGHHVLGHDPSLDDDKILRRVPYFGKGDLREVEADAFAAELILPRWLLELHCDQQRWTNAELQQPTTAYQLALRVGLSYQATCWTLARHKAVTREKAEELVGVKLKSVKEALLDGAFSPDDYHADVWMITERDAASFLHAGATDLLIFKLKEESGSGYQWSLDVDGLPGTSLVADQRSTDDPDGVGGPVTRRLVVKSEVGGSGSVVLAQARAWQPTTPLQTIQISCDTWGREKSGLPRATRRAYLSTAA
jgi:Zn-dependent peptidase ImmA (M78 family)/predicted secreted protein